MNEIATGKTMTVKECISMNEYTKKLEEELVSLTRDFNALLEDYRKADSAFLWVCKKLAEEQCKNERHSDF
jgi:hypothetical protein